MGGGTLALRNDAWHLTRSIRVSTTGAMHLLQWIVANQSTIISLALLYGAAITFSRLYLHPLAQFPGPRLAAISRWYEAYYDVVQNGQLSHGQDQHTCSSIFTRCEWA
ncbi:hypothetical protein GGR57DRAFT_442990 [Xylariaceae sp. FL1272]|nr:hypothetical protein GGR57DRAFT_442990 [Xylariaceae sp. FL1272]